MGPEGPSFSEKLSITENTKKFVIVFVEIPANKKLIFGHVKIVSNNAAKISENR